jgi:hypothetical protein
LREAPMAHIVLINPKFEISFWGHEHALPLIVFCSLSKKVIPCIII